MLYTMFQNVSRLNYETNHFSFDLLEMDAKESKTFLLMQIRYKIDCMFASTEK